MPRLDEGIWILPQLKRPKGFKRLRDSILKADQEARIVVIFDDDDPTIDDVKDLLPELWSCYTMGEGMSTTQKINYAVSLYPDQEFYGLLANDIEVQTEHALTLLAEHCPKFGLSYPNDMIQGKTLATHPCVSGELVRALGWWAYPKARHTCIDIYLGNIAFDAGGCVYLEKVIFEHHHFSNGKAALDEVYMKAKDYKEEDRIAANLWRTGEEVLYRQQVLGVQCPL